VKEGLPPVNRHPAEAVEAFSIAVRHPLTVYRFCKDIDGLKRDGTFPISGARVIKRYGVRICPQFVFRPISAYEDLLRAIEINLHLQEAGISMHLWYWISMCFEVFDSIYTAPGGRVPLPIRGERSRGYHQVAVCGMSDCGTEIRFVNSWGASWGDAGYGWISRDYLEKYISEAWPGWIARYGMAPSKASGAMRIRKNGDLYRWWMTKNGRRRESLRYRGRTHFLLTYTSMDCMEQTVECFELRDCKDFLIGWAFATIVPIAGEFIGVIHEFFIWPGVRRYGYGRLLHHFVLSRLEDSLGISRIEVCYYAADDLRGPIAPGRKFLEALGYLLRFERQKWLQLRGVGRRPV
jgi:hypothetical protein